MRVTAEVRLRIILTYQDTLQWRYWSYASSQSVLTMSPRTFALWLGFAALAIAENRTVEMNLRGSKLAEGSFQLELSSSSGGSTCCEHCSGHGFCSPRSGNCHESRAKSYYLQCATPLQAPPEHGDASAASSGDRCDSDSMPLDSRCTGCPPMYKGKLCASTTMFVNKNLAACGCGFEYRSNTSGINPDPRKIKYLPEDYWTLTSYTAALNCKSMDATRPGLGWCPSGCGGCYKLCATGGRTQSLHNIEDDDYTQVDIACKVFKVTDRCGDGYDNPGPNWCSNHMSWQECQDEPSKCRQKGNTNMFGYSAHFDLQNFHGQISDGLGWDNVEVTFEPVPCDDWVAPSTYKECKGCSLTNFGLPQKPR